MAVAQRKAGVRDQVRQAVGAAQQAGAGVVGEPLLRALPGGLERQGWGRAGLVLRSKQLLKSACARILRSYCIDAGARWRLKMQ